MNTLNKMLRIYKKILYLQQGVNAANDKQTVKSVEGSGNSKIRKNQ